MSIGFGERVRGALLGGAVGDALGWPIEFLQLHQIRERYGEVGITGFLPGAGAGAPQEITDDTQMTLFTAEGLLRWAPDTDVAPALCAAYLRWLDTQRAPGPAPAPDGWLAAQRFLYASRAPGQACMSGLTQQRTQYRAPARLGEPGPVNPGSKGCGAVMRSAPFGLVRLGPDKAFEFAARCGQLTHGHRTGYLAAGAFAALVDRLADGSELGVAVAETTAQVAAHPAGAETAEALRRAVAVAGEGPLAPDAVERVGAGWIAEECLAVAVACALEAVRADDPRRALLLSVNHSGDSDSTGAVCGNLLGVALGAGALPQDWMAVVEGRGTLLQVADDLEARFAGGDSAALGSRYPR